MNPVFLFTSLWIGLVLQNSAVQAQFQKSIIAESWDDASSFSCVEEQSNVYHLEYTQPFGVSNLNGLGITNSRRLVSTSWSYTYAFLSMPGLRSHSFIGAIGKFFNEQFFLGQKIGFGIYESGRSAPLQWFIHVQTNSVFSISKCTQIRLDLINWPYLIWPDSDRVQRAHADVHIKQTLDTHLSIGIGLRGVAGSSSQVMVSAQYPVNKFHELFAGMTIYPFGLGIAYGFQMNGLRFRFLIESSGFFGSAPYASVIWKP